MHRDESWFQDFEITRALMTLTGRRARFGPVADDPLYIPVAGAASPIRDADTSLVSVTTLAFSLLTSGFVISPGAAQRLCRFSDAHMAQPRLRLAGPELKVFVVIFNIQRSYRVHRCLLCRAIGQSRGILTSYHQQGVRTSQPVILTMSDKGLQIPSAFRN